MRLGPADASFLADVIGDFGDERDATGWPFDDRLDSSARYCRLISDDRIRRRGIGRGRISSVRFLIRRLLELNLRRLHILRFIIGYDRRRLNVLPRTINEHFIRRLQR